MIPRTYREKIKWKQNKRNYSYFYHASKFYFDTSVYYRNVYEIACFLLEVLMHTIYLFKIVDIQRKTGINILSL